MFVHMLPEGKNLPRGGDFIREINIFAREGWRLTNIALPSNQSGVVMEREVPEPPAPETHRAEPQRG